MADPQMYELCMVPETWQRVRALIEREWPGVQVWRMPDVYEDCPEIHTYALRGKPVPKPSGSERAG